MSIELSTWDHVIRSTEPADRETTEAAITELYGLAGRPRPEFRWVDSPLELRAGGRVPASTLHSGRNDRRIRPLELPLPLSRTLLAGAARSNRVDVAPDSVRNVVGSPLMGGSSLTPTSDDSGSILNVIDRASAASGRPGVRIPPRAKPAALTRIG